MPTTQSAKVGKDAHPAKARETAPFVFECLAETTEIRYCFRMLTVVESDLFVKQASEYLTDEQRIDFLAWLAKNPEAGDLIANSEGARKIRVPLNKGKSSGARVIYYRYDASRLHAVLFYAKSERESIKGHDIRRHKK